MTPTIIKSATLIHGCCLEYMATLPDKAFSLAICDPPYGIGMDGRGGSKARFAAHRWRKWERKEWDANIPNAEYFDELRRVSGHQIVWGGNYMTAHLPPSRCWIFWDKGQDLSMPDGELAWTSFNMPIRRKILNRCEAREDGLIHPTQKPVRLYEWLLSNYAKQGDKILDTHGGSMSSVIAAVKMGFEITCCELDEDYFEAAVQRVSDAQRQGVLI